jgi:hypothetical protein
MAKSGHTTSKTIEPLITARLHSVVAMFRSRRARARRRCAALSSQHDASARTWGVVSTGASTIDLNAGFEWSAVAMVTTRLVYDSGSHVFGRSQGPRGTTTWTLQ